MQFSQKQRTIFTPIKLGNIQPFVFTTAWISLHQSGQFLIDLNRARKRKRCGKWHTDKVLLNTIEAIVLRD